MPAHLRVFSSYADEQAAPPATVRMRLGDLFPLLAKAHRGNYLWLNDFEDDEIVVTEDLYDVLRAHRAYRPSA